LEGGIFLDNYKTIKELADELNISKQALQKRINKLPDNQKPKKVGGKFKINTELQGYFYEIFGKQQPSDNQVVEIDNPLSEVVTDLKKDKKDLLNRLEIKEKEMERMQKLLDQQQQLTLQSNKQIEQLQHQLLLSTVNNEEQVENDYGSKVDEKQSNEDTHLIANRNQNDVEVEENEQSNSKKWYQFWK